MMPRKKVNKMREASIGSETDQSQMESENHQAVDEDASDDDLDAQEQTLPDFDDDIESTSYITASEGSSSIMENERSVEDMAIDGGVEQVSYVIDKSQNDILSEPDEPLQLNNNIQSCLHMNELCRQAQRSLIESLEAALRQNQEKQKDLIKLKKTAQTLPPITSTSRNEEIDIPSTGENFQRTVLQNIRRYFSKDLTGTDEEVAASDDEGDERNESEFLYPNSLKVFQYPYFKDERDFHAPANQDVEQMKESGARRDFKNPELIIPCKEWTVKEQLCLLDAIEKSLRDRLLEPLMTIHSTVEKKLHSDDAENISKKEKNHLLSQAEECRVKIEEIRSQPFKDLVPPVEESHKIDWMTVSCCDGIRHDFRQCELKWRVDLHPSLIHSQYELLRSNSHPSHSRIRLSTVSETKMSPEDEQKLKALVMKYSPQRPQEAESNESMSCYRGNEWDKIAQEMGSGYNAFFCCRYYQLHLNDNLKKVGPLGKKEAEYVERLIKKLKIGDYIPWRQISYLVEGRTLGQIKHFWSKINNPLRGKRWDDLEDQQLMLAVQRFGQSDWKQVVDYLPGRDYRQCRERFMLRLNIKDRKLGNWTKEEDELIFKLAEEHNFRWVTLEKLIQGRNARQIERRYVFLMSRGFKLAQDRKSEIKKPVRKPNGALTVSSLKQESPSDHASEEEWETESESVLSSVSKKTFSKKKNWTQIKNKHHSLMEKVKSIGWQLTSDTKEELEAKLREGRRILQQRLQAQDFAQEPEVQEKKEPYADGKPVFSRILDVFTENSLYNAKPVAPKPSTLKPFDQEMAASSKEFFKMLLMNEKASTLDTKASLDGCVKLALHRQLGLEEKDEEMFTSFESGRGATDIPDVQDDGSLRCVLPPNDTILKAMKILLLQRPSLQHIVSSASIMPFQDRESQSKEQAPSDPSQTFEDGDSRKYQDLRATFLSVFGSMSYFSSTNPVQHHISRKVEPSNELAQRKGKTSLKKRKNWLKEGGATRLTTLRNLQRRLMTATFFNLNLFEDEEQIDDILERSVSRASAALDSTTHSVSPSSPHQPISQASTSNESSIACLQSSQHSTRSQAHESDNRDIQKTQPDVLVPIPSTSGITPRSYKRRHSASEQDEEPWFRRSTAKRIRENEQMPDSNKPPANSSSSPYGLRARLQKSSPRPSSSK